METSRSADDCRDSGWAWVVDFAGFLMVALSMGLSRALGILLVELIHYFDASVALSSLLLSYSGISFTLSGTAILLNTALGGAVHERALATLGSVVGSVGFLVTFFSTNLNVTTICLGLCVGITRQICLFASMSMMPKYFKKRLSLATGIAVSGASCWLFAWPVLMRFLIDTYTYRGAALIFSGILLNGLVCAALMRPVPGSTISSKAGRRRRKEATPKSSASLEVSGEKKPKNDISSSLSAQAEFDTSKGEEEVSFQKLRTDQRVGDRDQSTKIAAPENADNNEAFDCLVSSPKMIQHAPMASREIEANSVETVESHNNDVEHLKLPQNESQSPKSGNRDSTRYKRATFLALFEQFVLIRQSSETKRIAIKDIFALSLFKKPLFILFQTFTLFFSIGSDYLVLFYPAVTSGMGFTPYQSALLLSTIGISGIFGRLLLGCIGDYVPRRNVVLLAVSQAVMALAIVLCPFLVTFWAQEVFAVIAGLVYGAPYVYRVPLLLDFFEKEDMPKMLGICYFFTGLGTMAGTPLIGWLRDLKGDYSVPSYISAALILTNCGILLSMALLRGRFEGKSNSYDLRAES